MTKSGFVTIAKKSVYNLSAMPRSEAKKLVARNNGKICVRYARLPDGTVLTADTKFYQIAGRASRIAAGVLGASLTLAAMANAQPPTTPEAKKTVKNQTAENTKTSRISFTIYDPIRKEIPGAKVELINQKTKEVFTAVTNQQGVAQFDPIPRGDYNVNASAENFQNYQIPIRITQENEPNIKLTLEIIGMTWTGVIIINRSEIPVFQAVAQEDFEAVKQTINGGFDVNTTDKSGQTMLHVAVEHGNSEIVRFLLEHGAKVNIKNNEKQTPLLMLEDLFGDKDNNRAITEIVRLLAAKKADLNVRNDDKETVLMMACEDENLEVAKILLEAGANPNLKDEDGETAFQKTDSAEIRQLLVRYGTRQ